MRIMVAIMACIGCGGGTLALADPAAGTPPAAPSAQPATPAAATSSATPAASSATATQNSTAAPPAAAAAQAQSDEAADEKRLRAAGYKSEMHNGEKIWCRKEESLGSRLAAQRNCGTASSLAKSMQDNQRNVADSQRKTGTYMKGN